MHGTYPAVLSHCLDAGRPVLHARFGGAIEVGRDDDGSLFVVGELPFEDYLKGIAEVPLSWPIEALKAQAVAARSYALARLGSPDAAAIHFGYDLCATAFCQVYRGVGVEAGPWGGRWVRAVTDTRGQILLYRGEPATTFYFSTSNGRTFHNEDVFGGDPLPYLRSVQERDDGASPVSRWSVRMPLHDLSRFLRDAGLWSGPDVRRVVQHGPLLTIAGGDRSLALTRSELRLALNTSAPCLDPDRYPGDLPQTVPSRWFSATVRGGELRIQGRGWGHGVGMVQWGAYGKALRGMGYENILAYYYGGLRPEIVSEPATIRVGIATGLRGVTVAPSGSAEVTGLSVGPGPWRFTGGRQLRVRRVGSPEPLLSVKGFRVEGVGEAGIVRGSVEVDRQAKARLVLLLEGEEIPLSPFRPLLAGRGLLRGRLPPLLQGTYRVFAVVTDGIDEVRTGSRPMSVTGSVASSPTRTPSVGRAVDEGPIGRPGSGTLALVAAAAAATAILAGLLLLTRRRRRRAGC